MKPCQDWEVSIVSAEMKKQLAILKEKNKKFLDMSDEEKREFINGITQ